MRTALIALALAPVFAASAKERVGPTMLIVKGACERLMIEGRDTTSKCSGKLLNTSYSNGRVGFYFVTEDGAALTFTGNGKQQIKPDADTAVQPVDGIIFSFKGNTDKTAAVGTCKFTNPYKGPGLVACSAEAESGKFNAVFRTDGAKPSVMNP